VALKFPLPRIHSVFGKTDQSPKPHSRVRSIPAGAQISGDLDLRGYSWLRSIGADVRISGSLRLGGAAPETTQTQKKEASKPRQSHLTVLPDGLQVGGDLHLRSCSQLETLPPSLRVRGNLTLRGLRRLREIPPGVFAGNRLEIVGCPKLTRLPSILTPLQFLMIDGVGIESLPDDLEMAPDAEIVIQNCSRLRSLPEALLAGGNLRRIVIRNCPALGSLPNLIARWLIVLERLRLQEISSRLQAVRVRVSHCQSLSSIDGAISAEHLELSQCPTLARFPTPETALSSLNLRGCKSLPALPQRLRFVGSNQTTAKLIVRDCAALKTLPAELSLTQSPVQAELQLLVEGSGLKSIPNYEFLCRIQCRGVWLEPRLYFATETIEPAEIFGHWNAEVRRILLERASIENVLSRMEHQVIDEDADPGGPRRLILIRLSNDSWITPEWAPRNPGGFRRAFERLLPGLSKRSARNAAAFPRPGTATFLHCRCPSTGRQYLLPVPPTIRSCKAAAAWMAGFDKPEDYQPELET